MVDLAFLVFAFFGPTGGGTDGCEEEKEGVDMYDDEVFDPDEDNA